VHFLGVCLKQCVQLLTPIWKSCGQRSHITWRTRPPGGQQKRPNPFPPRAFSCTRRKPTGSGHAPLWWRTTQFRPIRKGPQNRSIVSHAFATVPRLFRRSRVPGSCILAHFKKRTFISCSLGKNRFAEPQSPPLDCFYFRGPRSRATGRRL